MAKTKYRDNMPALVEGYAKQGMIERDMALKLGVSVTTFEDYKNKIPEFLSSLKAGKEVVDHQVETSLYNSAMGHYVADVHVTVIDGEVIQTPYRRYIPPSITAQIFWLKNRKADEWRDTKEIAVVSVNTALKEAMEMGAKRTEVLDTNYLDITPIEV